MPQHKHLFTPLDRVKQRRGLHPKIGKRHTLHQTPLREPFVRNLYVTVHFSRIVYKMRLRCWRRRLFRPEVGKEMRAMDGRVSVKLANPRKLLADRHWDHAGAADGCLHDDTPRMCGNHAAERYGLFPVLMPSHRRKHLLRCIGRHDRQ